MHGTNVSITPICETYIGTSPIQVYAASKKKYPEPI